MNRSLLILSTLILTQTASLYASTLAIEAEDPEYHSHTPIVSLIENIEQLAINAGSSSSDMSAPLTEDEKINQYYIDRAGEHYAIKLTLVRLLELQKERRNHDFTEKEAMLRNRLCLLLTESGWDEGLKIHEMWDWKVPFYTSQDILNKINKHNAERERAARLIICLPGMPEDKTQFSQHVFNLCRKAQMDFEVRCDSVEATRAIESHHALSIPEIPLASSFIGNSDGEGSEELEEIFSEANTFEDSDSLIKKEPNALFRDRSTLALISKPITQDIQE